MTITTLRRDLLSAAQLGALTCRGGWFLHDSVALPEIDAQEVRELLAAGLLAHDGTWLEPTDTGRAALTGHPTTSNGGIR